MLSNGGDEGIGAQRDQNGGVITKEELVAKATDFLGEHCTHFLLVVEVPAENGIGVHTGIAREGSINVALGLCRRAEVALEREIEQSEDDFAENA